MKFLIPLVFLSLFAHADFQNYYCKVYLTDLNKQIEPLHLEVVSRCGIVAEYDEPIESRTKLLDACTDFSNSVNHMFWDITKGHQYSFYGLEFSSREYTFRKRKLEVVYTNSPADCVMEQAERRESRLFETTSSVHGLETQGYARIEDENDYAVLFPKEDISYEDNYQARKKYVNSSFRGQLYKWLTGRDLVE